MSPWNTPDDDNGYPSVSRHDECACCSCRTTQFLRWWLFVNGTEPAREPNTQASACTVGDGGMGGSIIDMGTGVGLQRQGGVDQGGRGGGTGGGAREGGLVWQF